MEVGESPYAAPHGHSPSFACSADGRCQHLIIAGEGEIIAAGGDGRIIPRRPGIKKGHALCLLGHVWNGQNFYRIPATDAPDKPRDLLSIWSIAQFPTEDVPAKFFVVHCQNPVNRALFQFGQ